MAAQRVTRRSHKIVLASSFKMTAFFLLAHLLSSVVLGSNDAATATCETGSIAVKIDNLRNLNQGKLLVGVFEEAKCTKKGRVDYDTMDDALHIQQVDVTSNSLDVKFDSVPHGEYAVCALHDMDGNRKLNTNFIGIPREDIAMSNNVSGGPMGGPKWGITKVVLNSNTLQLEPLSMVHLHK